MRPAAVLTLLSCLAVANGVGLALRKGATAIAPAALEAAASKKSSKKLSDPMPTKLWPLPRVEASASTGDQ